MATPRWVRRHRQTQHTLRTIALLELAHQAETRIEVEHETPEDWAPRRGMSFGAE